MEEAYEVNGNFFLILSTLLLTLGGLGGSYQPARLVLVGAVLFYIAKFSRQMKKTRPIERYALAAFAVIAVSGAISLIWTPTIDKGMALWITVAVGFMAFPLAIACTKTVNAARAIRDAWSWALVLTYPVALYEVVTDNHFSYIFEGRNLGGDYGSFRYASILFENYNNYSLFMCLCLPMMFGTYASQVKQSGRLFWGVSIAIAYLLITINTSRIAAIFAIIVLLYFLVSRKVWSSLFFGGIGFLVFLTAALFFQSELFSFGRMLSLRVDGLIYGDESVFQRWDIIQFGLDRLVKSYGFGFGIGSFESQISSQRYHLIPNAHNMLLELATNYGLYATVCFVAFLVALFVTVLRSKLPADLKFPPLIALPLLPLIGTLTSQAIGYTYWWIWLSSMLVIAACHPPWRQARPAQTVPQREGAGRHDEATLLSAKSPVEVGRPSRESGLG